MELDSHPALTAEQHVQDPLLKWFPCGPAQNENPKHATCEKKLEFPSHAKFQIVTFYSPCIKACRREEDTGHPTVQISRDLGLNTSNKYVFFPWGKVKGGGRRKSNLFLQRANTWSSVFEGKRSTSGNSCCGCHPKSSTPVGQGKRGVWHKA